MEDEFEDLPPISVNSPNKCKNKFIMPPADVLASQRAREVECERELQLLRDMHTLEEAGPQDVLITCCDSSGSEGEHALAAAVDFLRVQPDVHSSPNESIKLVELISRLLQHLPKDESQFVHDYLDVLRQGNPNVTNFVTLQMLEGLEAAVLNDQSAWDAPSILCCSAWLCILSVSGNGPGLRLRRALHALLQHATDEQVEKVGHIMSETLHTPQLLLELSDAVQGAPGTPRTLATQLVQLALDKEECSTLRSRYTLVQLTGRATALGLQGLLPPAQLGLPRGAPRTERLKVAVGASKLQLLFHNKN